MKGLLQQHGLNVLPAPKQGNGTPHLHLPAKPIVLRQATLVAAVEAAAAVEAEVAAAEVPVVHQEGETNMRYIFSFLLIAGLAINQDTYAQDYAVDALRFSQYQYGSSARLKALGNAQTAVGGDISSIGGNPAGIGLFTRSELSLTTEIMSYSSKSSYFNQNTSASRGRLDINNAGAVFVLPLQKLKGQSLTSGVISLNFGIGYNKTNDFGNKLRFSGLNPDNSVANFYADLANDYTGTLDDGSLEDAAYQSNLIELSGSNYVSTTNPGNRLQDEILVRNGSQSEFNLAAGVNIGNKFYIGTSVGFLSLDYTSDNSFKETGTISYPDNTSDNYESNYYQRYRSEGYGFNLKLGAIYRPNQFIRVGANYQSPNWYTIDENYSESSENRLSGNPLYEDQTVRSANIGFDEFTYGLKSPAKFSLGAALFENKLGFITGDIEFVDYSSMELQTKGYDNPNEFVEDNRYIVNNYKNAVNYRVGAELKAASPIMLRGGYAFNQSAFENSDQNLDIHTYSLGAGYRTGNINIDLAYQSSTINSQTSPYFVSNGASPSASSKSKRNGLFITIGTRF